ncbi:MAG: bifunctional proline dehydrogenase/L-glutamate gamma-semialdehyde dehydrogenase PutA [Alphaproteobacteria bacterium]
MTNSSMISLPEPFNSLAELYTADEKTLRDELILICRLTPDDRKVIETKARDYVKYLRSDKSSEQLIDTFLQEYGLSTAEGLTLMRLAEALIRTPDFGTGRLLVRDKLSDGDWSSHAKKSDSFWVNQATSGLRVTKQWIVKSGGPAAQNLAARLGDRAMGLGVAGAMSMMGAHFVLGRNIQEATKNARASERAGFTHSYDMLGEAAYTQADADRYFQSYKSAITHLANTRRKHEKIDSMSGISVKLSALHPRYEYAKRGECVPILLGRIVELAKIAKSKNLGITIDAEEAERLEVSLIIFDELLRHPELEGWNGLGIVIQAYQRRARKVVSSIIERARKADRKITVRLVKGAYWDMEIKRAQELGLESYPVFTRKENTDISYIACARLLFDALDTVYPQFATHNALTVATIVHMSKANTVFEFQRLHGMGEALHKRLMSLYGVKSRIYAPVGSHSELLPYLVRRLLENGANSSFVNQLFDEHISVEHITEDPFKMAANAESAVNIHIPAPTELFNGTRRAAAGLDITQSKVEKDLEQLVQDYEPYAAASIVNGRDINTVPIKTHSPADPSRCIGSYMPASAADIDQSLAACSRSDWNTKFTVDMRAQCLERAADLLEERMCEFLQLCTLEAGKSYLDGIAEVREAVDFCRYYAVQARTERIAKRIPLGTVACISPWNFPLAIFLGQIVASLAMGNTVVAKPAEQTPLISHKAIKLLLEAGVPCDAVHLVMGDGAELGGYLSAHTDIHAICFTGSTGTAKKIAANLASTNRSTLPFIAETGGINAMLVDSTALLEQAVNDVIASAFQSAGQRCSACRLVCVQDDIADDFMQMLSGAMKALEVGDPALFSTDVGPVIDTAAQSMILSYIENMKTRFNLIEASPPRNEMLSGYYVWPSAFEINSIADLDREIFGPVLHVMRYKASKFQSTVNDINMLGFGLTMGLHSRLDDRVEWVRKNAHVGNLYVNRNQIGAVVGVQPFGGEGLSGTGPKAGGPNYLLQLSKKSNVHQHQIITRNQSVDFGVPEHTAPDILTAVELASKSSKAWAKTLPANERKELLKTLMRPLGDFGDDFWSQFNCETDRMLPGPTGESNVLCLHPRGVIVCTGDTFAVFKQIALALYAGNSVIAVPDTGADEVKAFSEMLDKTVNVPHLLQVLDSEKMRALLNAGISGVAADGDTRHHLGQLLCKREGAILPILSADSDPERFFHERTVTINTTAAGGNATLLTLA